MLNRNFFLGALLALSVSFLVAFSNAKTEGNAVYEYVTIWYNNGVLITYEQGKEATQEQTKSERNTLNAAYAAINKFESQGYELFSKENIGGSSLSHSFLLRRKKQ